MTNTILHLKTSEMPFTCFTHSYMKFFTKAWAYDTFGNNIEINHKIHKILKNYG